MPIDKVPEGWSVHCGKPRDPIKQAVQTVSSRGEDPLGMYDRIVDYSDFAWDLTPEPKRIGPSRVAVLDYAKWAVHGEPWGHRHSGGLTVENEMELTWVLGALHAAQFKVMEGWEPCSERLIRALAKFDRCPRPNSEVTAHLGTQRHYFPVAVQAIHKIGRGSFRFQPGQLIEEPSRVGWYYQGNEDKRRTLKIRNLYEGDRELSGAVLVSE